MDADRFDTLARTLTSTRSRRSTLGAAVAAGFLGALGRGRGEPDRVAAQGECGANGELCDLAGQGGLCVIDFEATVLQGPDANRALVADGPPGTLRGYLRFALSGSGDLQNADLLLGDGRSLPVVGQVTGHSFQVRLDFGQGRALVAVGVGEQAIARCLGRIDGTAVGPGAGDLGEFHAVAGVQNIPPGDGNADPNGNGNSNSNTNGNGNAQPLPGGGGDAPQTGQGSAQSPTGQTGNANRADGSSGTQGLAAEMEERGATQSLPDGNAGAASEPPAGQRDDAEDDSSATEDPQPVPGTTRGGNRDDQVEQRQAIGETGDENEQDGANSIAGEGLESASAQTCPAGETRCGDACVDLRTDVLNCGACGNACLNGSECVGGACAPVTTTCPTGQTRCGEVCVDTTSSAANCSACGRACGADETCRDSLCVPIDGGGGCKTGLTPCGTTCANLQTDKTNCGACGVTCATGEGCLNGVCTPGSGSCPTGQVLCGTECRTGLTLSDGSIVCSGGGAPPAECPPGQALCNGACQAEGACQAATDCPPGQGRCYGICKDFQTDPGYCGSCSNACPGGVCTGGTCVSCGEGFTPCGATCVNTATDLDNCGFCGNPCGTQCIDGQCAAVGPSPVRTCPDGLTRCGNFCVDLAVNDANCGACDVVCPAPTRCTASTSGSPPGICYMPAEVCYAQGLFPCGTRCIDYNTDPNNCGACHNVCSVNTECQGGRCVITGAAQTLAPTDDEPVAETALEPELEPEAEPEPEPEPAPEEEIDAVEPAPAADAPAPACPNGQVECGGYCADLISDPYNCGNCGTVCGSDSVCASGLCSPAEAQPDVADGGVVEPLPEGVAVACLDAGGSCDPASPGPCCSGVCNDDGACA